jgi:hypothetical protein
MATENPVDTENPLRQPENNLPTNPDLKSMFKNSIGVVTIVIIWVLAGLAAFIISIYCFTKSGTTGEKILGLLLAIVLGPLYFIYAALNEKYCK